METEIKDVSLDQIDEPYHAMRTIMDEGKLEELAESIKRLGLIQPITLRKRGGRYEIIAGHRRYKASLLAGKATIPAVVRTLDEAAADEQRVHENLFREDVNPVDEGRYIVKMIEQHNVAPRELARMVGKSESYVRARYDLLQYPEYLIGCVEEGSVSLSAAQWLARIENDNIRKEYTRFAMLGGITARRAQAWFESWKMNQLPRDPAAFVGPDAGGDVEAVPLLMPCVLCQTEDDIENQTMVYAHGECAQAAAALAQNAQRTEARPAEVATEREAEAMGVGGQS